MKRNSLKSTFLYYANQQLGANYVLSLKAKFKHSCGKCMPSSRFSGFLQVLISHASKMRLLRQLVLVRRIFADSQEMVWPECKQCSAKAGHTISWESAKILRTNTNWRNRRILEAWEINTCRNPLNDGMHLPHEFLNLALRDRT